MADLVITGATLVDGTGAPPRTAHVAIEGDRIAEVVDDGAGRVPDGGEVVDATGLLLTPGWVDVHTHYDGQATWDPELAPSSHHGVTTAIMGNCGVGFAPVRSDGTDFLIELMEGVEDIPGTTLHEGIDWQWESFAEYLDTLTTMRRTIDLGALVPHGAVRAYVLGDRAHEDELTAEEFASIADAVEAAVMAGAMGFSTSRTLLHRSRHGYVPGTFASDGELAAITDALIRVGRGVFQYISDDAVDPEERRWLQALADGGVDLTYTLAQIPSAPTAFRDALDAAAASNEAGGLVAPQVPVRPTGLLFGLASSFHPFMAHPTYRRVVAETRTPSGQLGPGELARLLSDGAVASALVTETPDTDDIAVQFLATAFDQMYLLGDPPDYEPSPDRSAAAIAAREGRDAREVLLEWLVADEGSTFVFSPLGSYVDHDHGAIREMLAHPASIAGLSDGGAHCGLICDASFPTYLLTHWARDRTRGATLPVEHVVHKQTQATAAAYRLDDRGVIAEGMLADLNLIDHEALHLHAPRMVHDLPAGGRRLIQDVDGYVRTIKSGRTTFLAGEPTGERPGGVLRPGVAEV